MQRLYHVPVFRPTGNEARRGLSYRKARGQQRGKSEKTKKWDIFRFSCLETASRPWFEGHLEGQSGPN